MISGQANSSTSLLLAIANGIPESSEVPSIICPQIPIIDIYTHEDFVFKHDAGDGGTGIVFICEMTSPSSSPTLEPYNPGNHCAVKIPYILDEESQDALRHECEMMWHLTVNAPGFVVPFYGTYCASDECSGSRSASTLPPLKGIVMEYFPSSDLYCLLRLLQGPEDEDPRPLHPAVARWYIMDVLRGLLAIHAAGCYHGDIKAENLLMKPDGHVVFADFGDTDYDDVAGWQRVKFGTPGSQAPELCGVRDMDGPRRPSDIWAVGIMLFEMLFEPSPFYSDDYIETFAMIFDFMKYNKWPIIQENDAISQERARGLAFLKELLVFEPRDRINWREIVTHEWLRDHWSSVVLREREAPLVLRNGEWSVGKTWENMVQLPS